MMNVQTFFYNENLYRKLALAMTIVRLTPSHLTPKEYTLQLQSIFRRNKLNETIQFEQISSSDVRSRHQPTTSIERLEHHGTFLRHVLTISTELSLDIQTIVIETIDRVFKLIEQNLINIKDQHHGPFFKHLIALILHYDRIPNLREHCLERVHHFIDIAFILLRQSTTTTTTIIQMLIEQIGTCQAYFLLIVERILTELFVYFDQLHRNYSTSRTILINILRTIVLAADANALKQIINNESVRQQFHGLLYTCLWLLNKKNSLEYFPLAICLWNIYGRIV